MLKIYTIGHSNKGANEVIDKLKENNINVLVDVRSIPYSKYNPQFDRNEFWKMCENNGIQYVYMGRNLGGLLENKDYDKAINLLKKRTEEGNAICLMCSEANPDKCHRKSKLQPSLEEKGFEVCHILWEEKERDNVGSRRQYNLCLF